MKKDTKNLQTQKLIENLYKLSKDKKKEIYVSVAKILEASSKKQPSKNLFNLQKMSYINDGDIVVIPGKILGTGILEKKITIYALSFSESAKTKYKGLKTLRDFCKDNIDYKKVKLIK
ncbi:MAG TPA: 50S ribosomal protein L18e [archaeon]|jgi:large subunit ribosomal protein L18e|nr:50S ribosomal protein L18e [archaeon]